MKFTTPEFKIEAFHCPLCGTYAHMQWDELYSRERGSFFYESFCSCCKKPSLWRLTEYTVGQFGRLDSSAELIYPDNGLASLPEDDMPDDVKADYIEAARIFSKSPRGAAALLRLGLQKLCKHLGEDGENINKDVRSLSAKKHIATIGR